MMAGSRPLRIALAMTILSMCQEHQASAAPPITVLNHDVQDPSNSPGTMLHRFLIAQAHQHFQARRRAVGTIKTAKQIAQRQQSMKAFFLRSLGDFPDRTPLNSRSLGVLQREGYRIERLIFESRPGHHVTAALYLPEGKPPFPGVLVPCGHSANGKAAEPYQRVCILLAKNGLAALCYDPIGQGERIQMLDSQGKPAITAGSTTEHTMTGIGAMLVGRQTASYRIWDGLRALDLLAGRPEIDPTRLGCTGNSGGGTLTAYLMAIDERIAVAAPSCYITSLERLFATIGPQDAEQNITGQVAAGLDHADYITMRAPRPTLLSVGTQDFFDIQGSWDTFREVKLIYGRLGFGEHVDLFESDEPHGFTRPRRISVARWFRRWLLKQDDAIIEAEFPISSDAELQCTQTGQVLSDLKGVSVFDLNRQRERQLRPERKRFVSSSTPEMFRAKIKELLGLKGSDPSARPIQVIGRVSRSGYVIRKLAVATEPGIVVPALDLMPEWPDLNAPTIVMLGCDRSKELEPGGSVETLMRGGRRVILADLRGMGEIAPKAGRNSSRSPFGQEMAESFLSLHIGRPLLGQRVFDVLALLESLEAEHAAPEDAGYELVGKGAAGVVVLHSAALDTHLRIRGITVEDSLISWADVVEHGVSRDQLGSVVPGVLAYYDLPDLAARLEPCPVLLRRAVDAMGQPVSKPTVEAAYASDPKRLETAN